MNGSEVWLRKHIAEKRWFSLLGSVGLFFAALFVLAFTFGVIYLGFSIALGWIIDISSATQLMLTTVAIVLLSVGNRFTDPAYLNERSYTTGTVSDVVVNIPGRGSNVNPLAPDSMHSSIKSITATLFCGPRLVGSSIRMLIQFQRFGNMDATSSAAVLDQLLASESRVAFTTLGELLPTINLVIVLEELKHIQGVLFLSSEPPGLALSDSLRADIQGFVG